MKKSFIYFFLLLFLCTFVYAEEVVSKNTTSGGIGVIWAGYPFGILPGINMEYERLLNKNFALAVDIGLDGLILPYADLYARWYPWAGMFFANIGLGIWQRGFGTLVFTPVISPGIGWKIDIGKPNGWNLITGIIGRIFFYEDQRGVDYQYNRDNREVVNNPSVYNDTSVDVTAKVFFKVGYSF